MKATGARLEKETALKTSLLEWVPKERGNATLPVKTMTHQSVR